MNTRLVIFLGLGFLIAVPAVAAVPPAGGATSSTAAATPSATAAPSAAATPTSAAAPPAAACASALAGQSYALLVGGLGGQEPYNRWHKDWLARFQAYLTKEAGVPEANVRVLSGAAATADAVTGAIADVAKRAKPQDQFILFIVGHGEINGEQPTLTLPGPDLKARQLAAALSGVAAGSQVILNFSASSGDFLKFLVAPNRINITATSPTELQAPVLAEFFLRGLESKRADADNSGVITMVEAYNWAAQQAVQWIARWQRTGQSEPTDPHPVSTWQASGKEAIEIFEKLYGGLPTRQLDPTSDRTGQDAPVEVQPPNGEATGEWQTRRVIDEHPLLEDCGEEIGVSVFGEKGLQPVLGVKPRDPGYLAGHTILGRSAVPNP